MDAAYTIDLEFPWSLSVCCAHVASSGIAHRNFVSGATYFGLFGQFVFARSSIQCPCGCIAKQLAGQDFNAFRIRPHDTKMKEG